VNRLWQWIAVLLLAAGIGVGGGAVIHAATAPPPAPVHFGNCAAGQHWEQVPGNGDLGWECVR
jgi:hypothetical protein